MLPRHLSVAASTISLTICLHRIADSGPITGVGFLAITLLFNPNITSSPNLAGHFFMTSDQRCQPIFFTDYADGIALASEHNGFFDFAPICRLGPSIVRVYTDDQVVRLSCDPARRPAAPDDFRFAVFALAKTKHASEAKPATGILDHWRGLAEGKRA
jgi:hypothetical protein